MTVGVRYTHVPCRTIGTGLPVRSIAQGNPLPLQSRNAATTVMQHGQVETGCQCTNRVEHSTSGHCHSQAEQSFDLARPVSFQTNSAVTVQSHSRARPDIPVRTIQDNNVRKHHCRTISKSCRPVQPACETVKLHKAVLKRIRITLGHLRHLRHTRSRHWRHSGTQCANQQASPNEPIRRQSRLCSSDSLRDP